MPKNVLANAPSATPDHPVTRPRVLLTSFRRNRRVIVARFMSFGPFGFLNSHTALGCVFNSTLFVLPGDPVTVAGVIRVVIYIVIVVSHARRQMFSVGLGSAVLDDPSEARTRHRGFGVFAKLPDGGEGVEKTSAEKQPKRALGRT